MSVRHILGVPIASACLLLNLGDFAARAADSLLPPGAVVAHYTFDSANVSGATIFDTSGNGHNATFYQNTGGTPNIGSDTQPAASLVTGAFGQALSLNGTNQYAATNGTALGITSSFTTSIWWSRAGNDTNAVLEGGQWEFDLNGSVYVFTSPSSLSSVPGTVPASNGVWTNYTLVYDSPNSLMSLYKDGVLTGTAAASGDPPRFYYGGGILYFGTYQGTGWYTNGALDEAWIFNVPLTQSQIQNLITFNAVDPPATLTPEPASLVLFGCVLVGMGGIYWRRQRLQRDIAR